MSRSSPRRPEKKYKDSNFQGKGAPHAVSWVEHSTGPSHAVKWTVQCKVSGEVIGTGTADTKAAAKEEAAKEALAKGVRLGK
ncbi:hypothetical protein R3P38DRAFT_3034159 [Favolaschia claudopus]|uniref:DRBM domain-containing protein n=1 Tax=Favolaschia claudopus TaxID=2862362 RepID=A0AAW0ACS1_9AGAR